MPVAYSSSAVLSPPAAAAASCSARRRQARCRRPAVRGIVRRVGHDGGHALLVEDSGDHAQVDGPTEGLTVRARLGREFEAARLGLARLPPAVAAPPVLPGFTGPMGPSDSCRARFPAEALPRWQPKQVSRIANRRVCVRAAPTTPASRTTFTCRCVMSSSAAFVLLSGTRRSHWVFRGLLGLHSPCGPYAC
jgi:hypothetical protein